MQLSAIHLYPVKSTAGHQVAEAEVEPWGLRHDRRWMIVDPSGENVTARTESRLLTVQVAADGHGSLTLTAAARQSLVVQEPADAPLVRTGLSGIDTVRDAGEAAALWFSTLLDRPVRLVWQDDPRRREIGAEHGGRPGDLLNLADTGPLLLTTTASLQRLNDWVAETAAELGEPPAAPLVMDRFRLNVVVDGFPAGEDSAFIEDSWAVLSIGAIRFRAAELCDRCVLTTIEPTTRAKGKEPIRTLARHRRWGGAVWFGLRVIPLDEGMLRVGDPVRVLKHTS